MRRLGVTLLACMTLGACASGPRGLETPGPTVDETLAALPPRTGAATTATSPGRADAAAAYRRIEPTLPDRSDQQAVRRRIADLELRAGDETDPAAYRAAIARYEALLNDPDVPASDEVVYRLARAYEAIGDTRRMRENLDRLVDEHPYSEFVAEARFRRAESAFSTDDYEAAAADYAYVVDQGPSNPYWQNANYMLGWCHLKLGRYDESLERLFTTIATIASEGDALDHASTELLDDALRAVVLAVGDLRDAETLAAEFERIGRPSWQYLAYERLARERLAQQRYQESVATLGMFIRENPYDPRAPEFARRQVETLLAGNFLEEAGRYKASFVAAYGVGSDYWVVNDPRQRHAFDATLRSYLVEIAKTAHARAQTRRSRDDFRTAARYYDEFVRSFPDDGSVSEVLFLLGEARTEAGDYEAAVAAFQRVVREHPDDPRAAPAGHAAVLALDALLASSPESHRRLVERTRIDAQIEYATLFPDAAHAAEALANAADVLFEHGELDEAATLSQRVLDRPDLDAPLRVSATLILGHAAFAAADYAQAEARYRTAMGTAAADLTEDTRQWLLASIFKQAEAAEAAGERDAAVEHYLRLAREAPGSEIAARGHFDAVAVREGEARFADAARLLAEFRALYPGNRLAIDVATRLADLYEKSGQWALAAEEYLHVADGGADAGIRRQALYRSAQLFTEADDPARAIDCYRLYVKRHPEPFDLALEATSELARLFAVTGQASERTTWLERTAERADALGRGTTDRVRHLGAAAHFAIAEDARARFESIALEEPLTESLVRKRAALKSAVSHYEAAARYATAEFTTASTFRIAETYAALASGLLESERPAELSLLEREQYDILLEEQAAPFEEQAIRIHEVNVERSWHGTWDEWVRRSFDALRVLVPARFDKTEVQAAYVESIL